MIVNRLEDCVITGVGLEAQRLDLMEPFNPFTRLGGRGLRFKDRATLLALCAVQSALVDAGLTAESAREAESTGVVVSSNLGNIDTVCRTVETIRSGNVNDLGAMDLPNASSNIVASTIAIRFGCRGPNLMLCNGATSGLDAVYLGANLLRAGRAKYVIVAAVESRTEYAVRLTAGSEPGSAARIGEGAACVVVETAATAASRGARVYARLLGYGFGGEGGIHSSVAAALNWSSTTVGAWLWLTPDISRPPVASAVEDVLRKLPLMLGGAERLDLSTTLGEMYGALGVFQCATACMRMARYGGSANRVALATNGGLWGDGYSSLLLKGGGLGDGS